MWSGIAASGGIGIGRAVVIREGALDFSHVKFAGVEPEQSRLTQALQTFEAETAAMAARMQKTAGEQEGQILLGHITMVQDPFLQSQIKDQIAAGFTAEAALDIVCRQFAEMFRATGDALMMQRAADVEDIRTRLLKHLLGVAETDLAHLPAETVLVARELTPSMTTQLNPDQVVAIVTEFGGATSHAAILSRALEIPAVLRVPGLLEQIRDGMILAVDGSSGQVVADPDADTLAVYTQRREAWLTERHALRAFVGRETATADGYRVQLYANIGGPAEAKTVLHQDAEGIGLFRTEFLFLDRNSAPSEEEQLAAYRAVLEAMGEREVIFRTLDVGGDKPIPYLKQPREDNPFLGFRAVRYCLQHPDLFRTQLRALLRASVYGNLKIMLPLVTAMEEVRQVRVLLADLQKELAEANIPCREIIPLGVMVETPAACQIADLLAREADFFSIGTNDLIGYTMAVDRGNPQVAYLYDPFQPAVLRSIQRIIRCGREAGIPVGMCGEAAADPRLIPLLLAFGLEEFSVTPASVLPTRKVIADLEKGQADAMAQQVMALSTAADIRQYLEQQAVLL